MRGLLRRVVCGAVVPMLAVSVCGIAITVACSSCSPGGLVQRESDRVPEGTRGAPYSIIFIIHGDGDYLYHDTSGNEHNADEEAVAGAKRVAEQNPDAAVFIFHERPRRRLLFLFPLRDGDFSYYCNGRLVANESYWRDADEGRFSPEVELFRRFRPKQRPEQGSVFLYCGHEIPETGGRGYDESYPDRVFTIRDLANALEEFVPRPARFDLLVLATCYGGTPLTIESLGPFARYVIASPDNLHLSSFGLHALERLDLGMPVGRPDALPTRFAHEAFDRLTREVETAVTVAVYDFDRVREFVRSVHGIYVQTLAGATGEIPVSLEPCDCASLPAYRQPAMSTGVDVLYRPARFGRSKDKQGHSGWECRQNH